MKPKYAAQVGTALAAILLLGACASPAQPAAVSPLGTSQATEGGTLVYADVKPVQNVQTQQGRNYQINNVLNNLLDRLLYWNGETQSLEPWIAKDYSSNADATEFTFTIRPGVTFSDGSPLDADAVKRNLDVLGLGDAERQIPANQDFVNYESADVVDGNKVVIHLSAPNSHFLKATAAVTSGLLSPKTLELDNAGQSGVETIVGSGPFVFESQVPDQEIVLAKRTDYAWPFKSSSNQGAAHLDKVVIKVLAEVGLRAGALQSGQVDVARNIQPADEPALTAGGYQVLPVQANDLTVNYLGLRSSEGPLADADVRHALQIGFDRQELATTVLSDSYTLAGSVISHSSRGFVDLSADLTYDQAEANRLLDDAGWVKGPDGIRVKDGQQLKLTAASSTASVVIRPALEFIEQQWRSLGIVLDNRGGDNAFYAEAMATPTVPIFAVKQNFYGGLGPLFAPATNFSTYFADDQLNAFFDTEAVATDTTDQLAALEEQQRRLVVDDAYIIPLWDEVLVHGAAPDVHIEFTQAAAPIFQESWNAGS